MYIHIYKYIHIHTYNSSRRKQTSYYILLFQLQPRMPILLFTTYYSLLHTTLYYIPYYIPYYILLFQLHTRMPAHAQHASYYILLFTTYHTTYYSLLHTIRACLACQLVFFFNMRLPDVRILCPLPTYLLCP